ncbi:MAG: hypothetical protein AVDCRST_MAG68-5395, partial [uncultured Gemmatimonadetes bacterium]
GAATKPSRRARSASSDNNGLTRRHRDTEECCVSVSLCLCVSVSLCEIALSSGV